MSAESSKTHAQRTTINTTTQDAAQASTNDFVLVEESRLLAGERNILAFQVKNPGADTIVARVVGRNFSLSGENLDEKTYGDYTVAVDAADADLSRDVLSGASTTFIVDKVVYDEYAVQIESKVDDTPGSALVTGSGRKTN